MVRSFFFWGITGKLNYNSSHSYMQLGAFGWWYKKFSWSVWLRCR